jgi:hypothetical protein
MHVDYEFDSVESVEGGPSREHSLSHSMGASFGNRQEDVKKKNRLLIKVDSTVFRETYLQEIEALQKLHKEIKIGDVIVTFPYEPYDQQVNYMRSGNFK